MARLLEDRFWSKVNKDAENGCWLWTASVSRHGYGKFGKGKQGEGWDRAYRVAYRLVVGPIPEGLEFDHLCRNPSCVNPAHLQLVSHRDNMLRGNTFGAANAFKTHCPQGHPYDLFNTYFHLNKKKKWQNWCRQCATCRKKRIDDWNWRHRKNNLRSLLGDKLRQERP